MPAGNLGAYSSPEEIAQAVAMGALHPSQINDAIRASRLDNNTNNTVILEMAKGLRRPAPTAGGGRGAIVTREAASNPNMERIHALQLLAAGKGLEQGDFGMLQGPGMRTIQSVPELARRLGANPMLSDVRQQAGGMLGPGTVGPGRFGAPNPLLLQAELLRRRGR